MGRSIYRVMLRVTVCLAMLAVLSGCNESSHQNTADNTTNADNELVWDQGRWDDSNWQ